MQVDLCVFLAGNKLEEYTPLFIETLFMNCDTSNLHIHVVEKGYFPTFTSEGGLSWDLSTYQPVSESVHNYLLRKQAESPVPFTIYKKHDPREFLRTTFPGPPIYEQGDDQGNSYNWAMANCGTSKWVILCHSDMIFVGDIVTALMKEMNDYTGLYGVWNHCCAINREAFNNIGVKFNIAVNFRAVPVEHSGFDYVIRHASDPRCPANSKVIYGWDIGELLELIMVAYGWRCAVSQFMWTDLSVLVDHLGSGHEYTTNEEMKRDHASKRRNWMDRYGIQPV